MTSSALRTPRAPSRLGRRGRRRWIFRAPIDCRGVALACACTSGAGVEPSLAEEGPRRSATSGDPPSEHTTPAVTGSPSPPPPWRIAPALASPPWLTFGATHRTRYEYLSNQFRTGAPRNDEALALRTTMSAELSWLPAFLGAELADSRAYLADENAPRDTTITNPIDLLQAYAGLTLRDVVMNGDEARAKLGRMTIDIGSRRFVARNAFRNTINAFTGVDLLWTGGRGNHLRVFAALPVRRLPENHEAILANEIELDRESFDVVFGGVHLSSRQWGPRLRTEVFVFGLYEQDSPDTLTRDRHLVTPGARLYRAPRPGDVGVEFETATQLGESRASTSPSDVSDLEHLAFFVHVELGYTATIAWQPRVVVQYDYASGDDDPYDGKNGRFDTLFGARRFELGPTGIYGAFARANLDSPGARVEVTPHSNLRAFAAYRSVSLASPRDAWTTAGIWDPSGASGSFVGHQLEAAIRWRPLPGNVAIDLGFARTFLGSFAKTAPNATGNGDPTYAYAEVGFEI